MRFAAIAIAAASFLLFGAASLAADQAPPIDDWTNETVVVTAQAPGPAFWHLSKGDSEIWILGTLGPMPEKLVWNTKHLAEIIDGAKLVLTSVQASTGFFSASSFLLTNWGILSMPDDRKLEDSLPPDLRARFVAVRQAIKRDADRYEDYRPLIAGFLLESDYLKANKLSRGKLGDVVEEIADNKHVKTRAIARYDAMPMVKEMLKLGPEAERTCLENAVRDVETLKEHAVPAAEAWAVGDLSGIKAHYSTSMLAACITQTDSFNKLNRRAVDDTLNAIHEALAKPGKTVMLIEVGSLLRNYGVVEKLRAEGIVIEGPTEQ